MPYFDYKDPLASSGVDDLTFDMGQEALEGFGEGALKPPRRNFVDRLSDNMPTFGMDVPEEIRREIIQDRMRRFGADLMTGGFEGIGESINRGLGGYRDDLEGYEQQERRRVGFENEEEYHDAYMKDLGAKAKAREEAKEEALRLKGVEENRWAKELEIRKELLKNLPPELQAKWGPRLEHWKDKTETWHDAIQADLEDHEKGEWRIDQYGGVVTKTNTETGETAWTKQLPQRPGEKKVPQLDVNKIIRYGDDTRSSLEEELTEINATLNNDTKRMSLEASNPELLQNFIDRKALLEGEGYIDKAVEIAEDNYVDRWHELSGVERPKPSPQESIEELIALGPLSEDQYNNAYASAVATYGPEIAAQIMNYANREILSHEFSGEGSNQIIQGLMPGTPHGDSPVGTEVNPQSTKTEPKVTKPVDTKSGFGIDDIAARILGAGTKEDNPSGEFQGHDYGDPMLYDGPIPVPPMTKQGWLDLSKKLREGKR